MNKYSKTIIIVFLIILVGLSCFFVRELYFDYNYSENLKLSSSYFDSSMQNYDDARNILMNSNFSNEDEFNNEKKEILVKINNSITDMEKSIVYGEKMVNVATNTEEKEYAQLSLNASKISLKILNSQKDLFLTIEYTNWNKDKYYDLLDQKSKLHNQLDDINQLISDKLNDSNFREKSIKI